MIQDIAPHRLRNEYRPGRVPHPESMVFAFTLKGGLLVRENGNEIVLPTFEKMCEALPEGSEEASYQWLFTLDGTDCFWYKKELPEECSLWTGGFSCRTIRDLRKQGLGPQHLFFAAYTALQLVSWYRDNAYCGRCASPTAHSLTERALVCPSCGRTIYPRIIPAVIVGVLDRGERPEEDRIVLTKYAGRSVPYFALIAGFTEIGETLEETVHREVMEEVGLKVKNLRYYKSQPWAMADDILMGFYCDVDGSRDIRLDRSELKEGGWYTRDEVVLQPDSYSLTNEMMLRFKEGKI